jgi:hypothetical protein
MTVMIGVLGGVLAACITACVMWGVLCEKAARDGGGGDDAWDGIALTGAMQIVTDKTLILEDRYAELFGDAGLEHPGKQQKIRTYTHSQ